MAETVGSLSMKQSRLWALWPLGPIFNKELREMARRKRSYWLRFGYLAVLLGILGFTWLAMMDGYQYYEQSGLAVQAQRQATMGRVFFSVFSIFSIATMHLIGPVLTSTAIGSERLRRTFDVLLMTPISAWQIVCGKLFSRLLTALTLIGLTLPVLAIVRLLGGVELEDMFGAVMLSAAVAISSAAIGLVLSCWIKRAWAVILLAYIIQGLMYGLAPLMVAFVAVQVMRDAGQSAVRIAEFLGYANPILTAAVRIDAPRGFITTSWGVASIVQLVIASLLMLLAANVVRRLGKRNLGEGANTKPALPPIATVVAESAPVLAGSAPPPLPYASGQIHPTDAGRSVGDNPVLWREWRRPLLPRRWMRISAVVSTVGLLFLSYFVFSLDYNALNDADLHMGYAFVFHTLLLLMGVVLSATAVATEKESDTWTLLVVSPVSGSQVMWGKFVGVMRRMFWPWTIVLLHFGIFTIAGIVSIWSFILVVAMTISGNAIWVATGLYLSLRVTRVTTAVVLNLLLPIIVYGGIPLTLAAIEYGFNLRRADLAELSLYYLPYYYIGEGMDRIERMYRYGTGIRSSPLAILDSGRQIRLPFFDESIPVYLFLVLAAAVTLVFLGLTAAILHLTAMRFDRYVKRAR